MFFCLFRFEIRIFNMDSGGAKEDAKDDLSLDNTSLRVPGILTKAQSMESMNVNNKGHKPERRNSDVSGLPKVRLRRNHHGYSFDDIFARSLSQNHTAEVMDFVGDDSDNWSHASFDSSATDPQMSGVSMLSLASITPNPNRKRLPANLASLHHETCNSHVVGDNTSNHVVGDNASTSKDSHALKSSSRRGLSHSMILNWLVSKKYPTISESSNTENGPGNNTLQVPNKSDSAGNSPTEKLKFSYRDLNAVAPNNW